jgi:hypothetical protein
MFRIYLGNFKENNKKTFKFDKVLKIKSFSNYFNNLSFSNKNIFSFLVNFFI